MTEARNWADALKLLKPRSKITMVDQGDHIAEGTVREVFHDPEDGQTPIGAHIDWGEFGTTTTWPIQDQDGHDLALKSVRVEAPRASFFRCDIDVVIRPKALLQSTFHEPQTWGDETHQRLEELEKAYPETICKDGMAKDCRRVLIGIANDLTRNISIGDEGTCNATKKVIDFLSALKEPRHTRGGVMRAMFPQPELNPRVLKAREEARKFRKEAHEDRKARKGYAASASGGGGGRRSFFDASSQARDRSRSRSGSAQRSYSQGSQGRGRFRGRDGSARRRGPKSE